MKSAIAESFTPRPDMEIMSHYFDIKTWMKDIRLGLHNIIYPHVFRFSMADGKVRLKYKNWVNDPVWLPENSSGLEVLKVMIFID